MKTILLQLKSRLLSAQTAAHFFTDSFRIWPFKQWLLFWFTNRKISFSVPGSGALISTRHEHFLDKITDGYAVFSCVNEEQYNSPGFELQPGSVVIDVGGHIGSFTVWASSRVKKVIVFEPRPDNFSLLQENIRQNSLANVWAYPHCVAGQSGLREIHGDPLINTMHSLYNRRSKRAKTVTVQAVSLKEIFKSNSVTYCDFLKIDCEGAEYEIIGLAPLEILQQIGRIAMEYHLPPHFGLNPKEHSLNQLTKRLRGAGFAVTIRPVNSIRGLLFATQKRSSP